MRSEIWDFRRLVDRFGLKWVFLVIILLHGLAILFFTRGFLLTRTELSHYSQCDDIYGSPCFHPHREQNSSGGCWTKPAVDRLVIIVLDALRFDFVAPSTFFAEKKQWMDKLKVLHSLAHWNQSAAAIFKAIADPPTTSLQRLKGLTTGGLPTFIDVGNSFGAPEIVEDSWIQQLAMNGKKVVLMGDDTWMKLFPNHFTRSYPFPSFNVKDLDTVDNGCIENLIPSLYEEDWDVLIAHFLGMDHAGHIFGVDSRPMIEKLEQYNEIITEVVGVLESQSGPGGLHENTMLLVMGDHGQTLNGDHGGGTVEEVETAIFALSLNKHLTLQLPGSDSSTCQTDAEDRRICVRSIQQLDFAATLSALLGIPFPFGSIGRVNPELYSLGGGSWNDKMPAAASDQNSHRVGKWFQDYANVLCINSWQVKKYVDTYSSMSLIGFTEKELQHISDLYSTAQQLWSSATRNISFDMTQRSLELLSSTQQQVDAFSLYLESVAVLARSNWTEFNFKMMGMGLCIMLTSLYLHLFFIRRLERLHEHELWLSGYCMNLFGVNLACFVVVVRVFSFLSNSFILEEGRVASFLLATTSIIQLHYAVRRKRMFLEGLLLCALIPFLRFSIELGQLKQAVNSLFLKVDPSQNPGVADSWFLMCTNEVAQMLSLIIIAYVLCKSMYSNSSVGILKYVVAITLFNFLLIFLFWASDSPLLSPYAVLGSMKGNLIPRVTYAAGLLQLLLLALPEAIFAKKGSNSVEPAVKALAILSAWSPTIIILSGKQGSMVLLALFIGGWCISRLSTLGLDPDKESSGHFLSFLLPVTQWSLLAACMFFASGHWCSFDGLRYAAAFIGFDEFNLIPQAILLTVDTFGFSIILPVLALPILASSYYFQGQKSVSSRLCQVYLVFGFMTALAAALSMLCVTIHRRHLMVWGLFAPKYVFDVVGLLLTDLIMLFSAVFYFE